MNTTRIIASVASIAAAALASNAAHAAATFTTVANNAAAQKTTLAQTYGGTWVANGKNFTNGTLTATRVADGGVNTPSSLTTGVAGTDDLWTGGTSVMATVLRDGSSEAYSFGYLNDTSSSHPFVALLNTNSIGSSATANIPTAFRWGLKELTGDHELFTSHKADNSDWCATYDHMITYRITGDANCQNQWILFWQDEVNGCSSPCFTDAVIKICRPNVPAPGAAALGLMGVGLLARRKRKA